MKIVTGIIFLFAALTSASDSVPAEPGWIRQSIDLTINTRFTEAESLLTQRMAAGDSSIEVCFYYASVLNSKMTHYENLADGPRFTRLLQKVIAKSNRQLHYPQNPLSDKQRARLYFYRGSAYGYLAYFAGQNGSWYRAMNDGFEAIDDLRAAVEADSTLYDAYLGIGVYYYWKSTKLKFILWLPFFPDRREEGIALIKKSIENDAVGKYMAMHQLVYILLDYGKYDEALEYARQLVQKYPRSVFMWWAYAHTFYKRKEYPKAVRAYNKLLSVIDHDEERNSMQWLHAHVMLAEIYQRMGDSENSVYHCQMVLSREYSENDMTERGYQRLKKARTILEEEQQKIASKGR
ncbi:MAG TPA: tetratricopeptide repeat protein [Caldithrix abyssi]|uniref:Tetratricopeptide repeat protein n=1 Tax=Caldithrix abyssi TaxID=187145 RepID=A0A7V4U4R7_CALAY|nr:tetratricopeptide repeat protein [Caldithrix abyssi]